MSPLTDKPSESVAALGEVELLRRVRAWLGAAMPPAPEGMGDDCAVLSRSAGNLFAADSLLFGRHFEAAASPEQTGAKLLLRNLSDIAAMGGEPRYALISAFLPPATALIWLERFCRGLAACALEHGCALVGGDMTQSSEGPGFSLAITGQASRPLFRTGSQPGDHLFVTGELGGSLRGRHLSFAPRLGEGRWLAGYPEVHACIDLTDGLGKDVRALLGEDLSAELSVGRLPISAEANAAARESGKSAFWHACNDGEDYELLFTLAGESDPAAFLNAWRSKFTTALTSIGRLRARASTNAPLIDEATGEPLHDLLGYTHFA